MSRLQIHQGSDAPDLPECPSWLGTHGKSKWKESVAILQAEGSERIRRIDGDFLAMYCEAFDELHEARETLAKYSKKNKTVDCVGTNGSLYPHPAEGRKNKAIDRIRKFGRELGLSQATRKSQKKAVKLSAPTRIKPA